MKTRILFSLSETQVSSNKILFDYLKMNKIDNLPVKITFPLQNNLGIIAMRGKIKTAHSPKNSNEIIFEFLVDKFSLNLKNIFCDLIEKAFVCENTYHWVGSTDLEIVFLSNKYKKTNCNEVLFNN